MMTLKPAEILDVASSFWFIGVTAIFIISVTPFLTPRLRRFEVPAIFFAFGCLAVPIIFEAIVNLDPGMLLGLVGYPLAAPFITLGMLVGGLDGEFYREGMLGVAVVGWWEIVWGAALRRRVFGWRWGLAEEPEVARVG